MCYSKKWERIVNADLSLAKEFSNLIPCPFDRPAKPKRVQKLKEQISQGRFWGNPFVSAYCGETDVTYRVNAKHTSMAMAELEGSYPAFTVTRIHFHCDNLKDVADLYSTFDTREGTRSLGEVCRPYMAANATLSNLPTKAQSLAMSGLDFYYMSTNQARGASSARDAKDRAERLLQHPDFGLFVLNIVGTQTKGNLLARSPVVGAMAATYEKDAVAAGTFWMLVKDESNPNRDAPDRVLARYLTGSGLRMGGSKSASPREMYAKCIYAWNAWRDGDDLTQLKYYPNKDLPKPY